MFQDLVILGLLRTFVSVFSHRTFFILGFIQIHDLVHLALELVWRNILNNQHA